MDWYFWAMGILIVVLIISLIVTLQRSGRIESDCDLLSQALQRDQRLHNRLQTELDIYFVTRPRVRLR